jgi:Transposase DDE domain
MNSALLYQWTQEIDKHFGGMGRWQIIGLALFSYGVVLAESCRLNRVARALTGGRGTASLERRLERWLANDRWRMEAQWLGWVGWVMSRWGQQALLLLVDETKLSDHVAVMVISLYYRGSALPLVWRAYRPSAYPTEGQVELLRQLFAQLRTLLPPGVEAIILADRGLGTSPRWQQALTELGWDYLLRVQRSTLVRLPNGKAERVGRLVGYGQRWLGRAQVFKKAGWQWRTVCVLWEVGYAEPWCLFSNLPRPIPDLYAWRFAQEASFRDLKSDGFQWHTSHVWQPAHLERLLFALALAAFWVLTTGTLVFFLYPLTAHQQRLSCFRLGLDELFARFRSPRYAFLDLHLVPDTPPLKTVGW